MLKRVHTKSYAMVAVSPGIEPIIVPAATPNKAKAKLSSVNAARKLPISIVIVVVVSS